MKTKAEKRIEIARDVLKQIKIGRLNPSVGIWVHSQYLESLIEMNTDQKLEVRDVIKDKICHTCALGSLFIAALDKFDKLKIKNLEKADYLYTSRMTSFTDRDIFIYLKRFFDKDQLNLMEIAFELGRGFNCSNNESESNAAKWGNQYSNASDRLRAIMLNLIRNKGTFIVPKRLPSRR